MKTFFVLMMGLTTLMGFTTPASAEGPVGNVVEVEFTWMNYEVRYFATPHGSGSTERQFYRGTPEHPNYPRTYTLDTQFRYEAYCDVRTNPKSREHFEAKVYDGVVKKITFTSPTYKFSELITGSEAEKFTMRIPAKDFKYVYACYFWVHVMKPKNVRGKYKIPQTSPVVLRDTQKHEKRLLVYGLVSIKKQGETTIFFPSIRETTPTTPEKGMKIPKKAWWLFWSDF